MSRTPNMFPTGFNNAAAASSAASSAAAAAAAAAAASYQHGAPRPFMFQAPAPPPPQQASNGQGQPPSLPWAALPCSPHQQQEYVIAPVTCMLCTDEKLGCFFLSCGHYPLCPTCFKGMTYANGDDDPAKCPQCNLIIMEVHVVDRIKKCQ